jgi:hypothetical protein
MNSQTFSRAFLQSIPEQRKQQHIDMIIQGFLGQLQNEAAAGKTFYMYAFDERSIVRQHPPLPVITNDDLISAFQRKFPDCYVSYEERWIDINPNNRVLKKGIVIDWS